MYRISYSMMIEAIENEDTEKIIGLIDTNEIEKNEIKALNYIFPLIERITLEIYKLLPLSDVEHYEQGIMRTIIPIIENDPNQYFPENLINILKKYFDDKGLRNKLFHVLDDTGTINIDSNELDFIELKVTIMQLVSILRDTCKKYSIGELGKIELVK